MTIAFEDVVIPQPILLVEDEQITRDALASLLRARDYEVVLAASGSGAILKARRGNIGIVLMDIILGDEMDGIEAAQEIQIVQPLTSFIFVSAYANDPAYRERVQKTRVRVGGWLEKPINIDELIELIQREFQKLQALAWLTELPRDHTNSLEYLATIEEILDPLVYQNLRAEVEAGLTEGFDLDESENIRPLVDYEENPLMQLASDIDSIYKQIRDVVAQHTNDTDLQTTLRPLRERLEELQMLEADAMERRFRAQLHFDPTEGHQLIERAQEILKRK